MIEKAGAWMRLPEEMRARPQWVVAGASKAPLSVGADGKLFNTSVNRPSEWMAFDKACQLAWDQRELVTTHTDKKGHTVSQTGLDIGFILNEADPFTCIDLDVKDAETSPLEPEKWTSIETFNWYWSIVQRFDSFTERSRSGKGFHVWVGGAIGRGFRRDGVEVYSQERFIICTGNVVLDRPVVHHQQTLDNMVSQMRPVPVSRELVEVDPIEDDWAVLEKAVRASNSEKFCALWRGDFKDFPSQSEADLALMSMFTFYSESNAQCKRLFRESALGKREKAVKDDRYLNLTLTTIRDRQSREQSVNIDGVLQSANYQHELYQRQAELEEIQRLQGGVPAAAQYDTAFGEVEQLTSTAMHVTGQGDPIQADTPAAVAAAQMAPMTADVIAAGEKGLPWPPGFAGRLAQYIYQSAPRPVKEVAIVAALGLLAGICGKAWHIPQSGLNLYIILIARSAIGKEAMHSGISSIIKACARDNPGFYKYVDFSEYASGPALTKACVVNPCFLNVSGEWGRRLKRLGQEDGRDGALQTLRTQMTNLYQKSGPQAIVGGIGYSSQDNNVASVAGVSYSMIGETTPGTFYEALTESMMEDGFLSRFLVIEYQGQRPAQNEHPVDVPDQALRSAINNMAMQADLYIAKDYSHLIGRDEASALIMKNFELECDRNINSTDDESRRQMWNRAALKALRIAGLLSVADNWMTPCIHTHHIEWAIDVIRRDIDVMKKRLDGGDVGMGDKSRERKLVSVLKEYLTKPVPEGYKVHPEMPKNQTVTRGFLQIRTKQASSFYNHKMGANKALDDTIAGMLANGYLMEVQKDAMVKAYGYHGKAYRILPLPDYEDESKN